MKCTRRNFLLVFIGLLASLRLKGKPSLEKGLSLPTPLKSSSSVDHSLLLHCIALVESGDDDTKIGPKGERSRYQISEAVWVQHVSRFGVYYEFFENCKGKRADQIATDHLNWLDLYLPSSTSLETNFREYCLAWAWHGGLDSWLHPKDSDRVRLNNYAVRVTNLYDDLKPKWRK